MKRLLSFSLPLVVAIALAALDQAIPPPSPGSTNQVNFSYFPAPTPRAKIRPLPMAQSGTFIGMTSSSPIQAKPVKSNSSEDLSQDVRHRVRIQGTSISHSSTSVATQLPPPGFN